MDNRRFKEFVNIQEFVKLSKIISNTTLNTMTDKYCLPGNYIINDPPMHYIDLKETDRWQLEVYLFCKKIMEDRSLKSIIDVGCGSGYKLVHYLGNYDTIGFETEPCISFLRETYPTKKWINSGEPEKSFVECTTKTDVVICSDVIEHIVDPSNLIKFLLSIDAKYYIISTPCRDVLVKYHGYNPYGPPKNKCHVREWTMDELKLYLSQEFTILESHYAKDQHECQFHLLTKK